MATNLIRGGTVVDLKGSRRVDVRIGVETGTIVEVGLGLAVLDTDADVLDIEGCLLTPGFVDLHTHVREPGDEANETIESASRAAALGGYSAIVVMPDTEPVVDNADLVLAQRARAATALCEVISAGALSMGNEAQAFAPLAELARSGVRTFTDCGLGVQDAGFLLSVMEYVSDLRSAGGQECVVAQKCDLVSLSRDGHMNEGEWSSRLGLAGKPDAAEEIMVVQALALAELSGAKLHLQHLSTKRSFDLVREAKANGVRVTADVSPHHLVLTEASCAGYDPVFKTEPPLRTLRDQQAAISAIADGTIDAIATGHAPHSNDAKERPFDQAPAGVLGLETTLSVLLTHLVIPGLLEIEELVGLLSWRPAAIAGVSERHGSQIKKGVPANLVVLDLAQEWIVQGEKLASRSANTPFNGESLIGKVRHTLRNGEFVVKDFEATR